MEWLRQLVLLLLVFVDEKLKGVVTLLLCLKVLRYTPTKLRSIGETKRIFNLEVLPQSYYPY